MNQKDKEKRLLNAKKANIFAGKRFLGFTPKGGEVWINMELQKDSKTLSIECSHNLSVLLQPGAKLATKRVTVKKGSSTRGTASELLRRNQKNMGGEVRPETILHMQRLISAVDMKFMLAFKNDIPTKLLFQYISNAIYEGSYDIDRGDFCWVEVMETWDLPSGDYFILEQVPQDEEILNLLKMKEGSFE